MSRTDAWMPFYVGDYLGDTSHLRMAEHGAYVLLLMHYWRTGPLPDDDRALAAIARATPAEWRQVGPVVRQFFAAREGKLYQKRAEAERARVSEISAKRKDAAGARWKQKAPSGDANAMHVDSKCNASASVLHPFCTTQSQSHQPSEERRSLRSLGARDAAAEPDGFAEWWAEYPRKDAKDAARRAFAKACRRASPAQLLTGLRAYPFDRREFPRFVPHPATWLNDGRWESAHETPVLPLHAPNSRNENAAAILREIQLSAAQSRGAYDQEPARAPALI